VALPGEDAVQPARHGELASAEHWEAFHSGRQPRLRLPSPLVIATRNLHQTLRAYVKPGMDVLEIGFAPGKHLAFVAKDLHARVAGVDFSENGVRFARQLFETLGLAGDLRCENIFDTTLADGTFDFVYSVGVIEHFADPREIARRHVALLRPGATALILIPNYKGLYGAVQRYFDPANLAIHNLEIMTCDRLQSLAPKDLLQSCRTFRCGRLDPSQVSLHGKWPRAVARASHLALTAIGHVQPVQIGVLCPWLALEMTRARA
jgi:2-polyprenyl-3-methyl-5-hydroxy-6-metoxy-1,4-benzoquinol methylase